MTGMRSWIGFISALAAVVMIVQDSTAISPMAHTSHSPAKARHLGAFDADVVGLLVLRPGGMPLVEPARINEAAPPIKGAGGGRLRGHRLGHCVYHPAADGRAVRP